MRRLPLWDKLRTTKEKKRGKGYTRCGELCSKKMGANLRTSPKRQRGEHLARNLRTGRVDGVVQRWEAKT